MRVKSILNQVEKYKDFVYERVRWQGEGQERGAGGGGAAARASSGSLFGVRGTPAWVRPLGGAAV